VTETAPRVTLAIATHDRPAYLAEALASAYAQDYADIEIVVVDDASGPETVAFLASQTDPRLRVVRLDENVGMVGAFNRLWQEARGELVVILDDDDVCLPDRVSRSVAVFDRHPDTDVAFGDSTTIDADGVPIGEWTVGHLAGQRLLDVLVRQVNMICHTTVTVRRSLYVRLGGYDADLPVAQDYELWLRALPAHVFRTIPGGPVVRVRRHGANSTTAAMPEREQAFVDLTLRKALGYRTLRELVPEVAWDAVPEAWATRSARLILAAAFDRRGLDTLASELRALADAGPATFRDAAAADERFAAVGSGPPIVLTSFGWDDTGGGTRVPRNVARELVRRGYAVTVFHAATAIIEGAEAYAVRTWWEDGVELVGVFNRPHALLDLGHPLREIDDPPIARAFASVLDRVRPVAVHYHNLHNLGASLVDESRARGIPAVFSTHNYWLLCPRNYLFRADLSLCSGPADEGRACAACVGTPGLAADYALRRTGVADAFSAGVETCLAVSETVARVLVGAGFARDQVQVLPQAMPEPELIWAQVGRGRRPGRRGEDLVIGFVGSAYAHKGPQVLVAAAQRLPEGVRVVIHGDFRAGAERRLRAGDGKNRVEIAGSFAASDLPSILAGIDVAVVPSVWWDCAPLVVAECLAAGVPVVASRMGGIAESVRHDVDGLLVGGGDADALADALTRLAEEPGLLERLQGGIDPPASFGAYVDALEEAYRGRFQGARWGLPSRTADGHEPGPALPPRPADDAIPWHERPPADVADLPGGRARTLVAAPAWRGDPGLGDLLAAWATTFAAGDDVALVLVADAHVDGDADALAAQVEDAARQRGIDLEHDLADIVLIDHAPAGRSLALAAACQGFVDLHRGAAGLRRAAVAAGVPIVAATTSALRAWASEQLAA
jgi:glycosyltransferase involved in cell wall biosynthesis